MHVRPLPKSFKIEKEIIPPFYDDHLVFSEHLKRPYECPEHTVGIGLLTTARANCEYYVNGFRNHVNVNKVSFINRGSRLSIRIKEHESVPVLLFFNSNLPDLVQHSLNYGHDVLLEQPFDNLPYDFSYLERLHINQRLQQTILSLVELGRSCSSFAALKSDMIIRNLFEDLLKDNRAACKLSQNIQAIKASTRLEIFKRVSAARDWIEEYYHTNITLEDIAAVAVMNSEHFLRMFKQIYLITPHQYLIELRLKKAKSLLECTPLTINDICQSIGFESVFSFSVLFKNRFGIAPSHYRKIE